MAKMMRDYLFLLLFLVSSIKNKIFVGEYSAKEAQHLFENELSYLRPVYIHNGTYLTNPVAC